MLVPQWLERLLNTTFFVVCRNHGAAAGRSECNMYCLDCNVDAFCFYCRSSKHSDHQIRRSSYHDVVRVSEIQKVLDISAVQTYVINSARVLFLNQRPVQPNKAGKSVPHICEICGRSLLDTFRFCSLACKLVGIKKNDDASFSLNSKNHELTFQRDESISRRKLSSSRQEQLDDLCEDISPTTPSPPSNARRRKGIPQRAPFMS